jgi:uncharacterized repeat protein (TIGR01451 family)
MITDPDPGAQEGLAVIGVDDSNGEWQYSTNNGSSWIAFGAVFTSSATLLSTEPGQRVRFAPDEDWNGSVAGLTFRAWDRSDGHQSGDNGVDTSVNGGDTAYSIQTETASITVLPVDDPVESADMALTKRASQATAEPGDVVTYTLTIINRGPGTAATVFITDTLPSGMMLESAPADCVPSGSDVYCSTGPVAPGQGTVYDLAVRVTASESGRLVNTAEVSGAGPDPVRWNNTDSAAIDITATQHRFLPLVSSRRP